MTPPPEEVEKLCEPPKALDEVAIMLTGVVVEKSKAISLPASCSTPAGKQFYAGYNTTAAFLCIHDVAIRTH